MENVNSEDIAIVGMSCRFPGGANSPIKLWSMLVNGQDAWSDVPLDRFRWQSFHHPDKGMTGVTNHRGGHFLDQDISLFDASFFGISPTEAHSMDPQQRILLEVTYEAMEDAGIPLGRVKGTDTGVFVAMFNRDYDRMMNKDLSYTTKHHMTGVGDAIVSNRLSYIFDLKGPSMTLDTGCSGSLVALHQACLSLRAHESGMAFVGGVNLLLSPDSMIPMSLSQSVNMHVLSMSLTALQCTELGRSVLCL